MNKRIIRYFSSGNENSIQSEIESFITLHDNDDHYLFPVETSLTSTSAVRGETLHLHESALVIFEVIKRKG